MSDVEIVISVADDTITAGDGFSEAQHSTPVVLQQFPGHSPILSLCPYFVSQALRWSKQSEAQCSNQTCSMDIDTAGSYQQSKKQVNITLPDASYEPAAVAVLAGLYPLKSWPKLLADLTPQQQVQAAVLADKWQLTAASEAAVEVLQEEAESEVRVSAVLGQLLSLAAVPDCLMPVFERVLLSKYGDLEAVWSPAGASLQDSLLALPLYAIELLLASDRLKVASEDTVLFTAHAYDDKMGSSSSTQLAADKLAPLVRCPHLSQFWLSALVLSDDAPKLLLRTLQPQLKRLLLLKAAGRSDFNPSADVITKGVPDVPASWLLPARDITPISSKTMQLELDVAAIRQAANYSASQQTSTKLASTPADSCIIGGVDWGIELWFLHNASNACNEIAMYVHAKSLPADASCRCTYTLECAEVAELGGHKDADLFGSDMPFGSGGFPMLDPISGPIDEAAWAAAGLPTNGSIVLQLTVSNVGM